MKRYYYVASLLALCQLIALGETEKESKRRFEQGCFDTYELPLMKKSKELENTFFINWRKRARLKAEIEELKKNKREAGCF